MVIATETENTQHEFDRETSVTKQMDSTPRQSVLGRSSAQRVRNYSTSSQKASPDIPHYGKDQNYGTDPTSEKSRDSDVLQNQKIVSPVVKRRWFGLTEIVFNVIGTLGFTIGSLLWILGTPVPGTLTFAVSCVCCGISCTIYALKFYLTDDFVGVYALLQQAAGCGIFTICSIVFLYPEFEITALIGFFSASSLFLTGCILTQIQCRSWCGVMAPVHPVSDVCLIPTSLFNTLGSILFTVGSICLFYNEGKDAGSWCYEIGSIIFFFASWGDATIWWKLGLTQSEHQQTSTVENDYAAVKFL